MEVLVTKEVEKDTGRILYKIQRRGSRRISTAWWTRNEAENLYAQLENVLYKQG